MNHKSLLLNVILGLLTFTLRAETPSPRPDRPNIVLMVADDLGYGDLSSYGATRVATPRIDSLARDGARFTDAHSYSGICMPSRYAILSGTYAFRARRTLDYAFNFEPGQILLPQALKASGYRTAMLGKWHNGFGAERVVNWNAELKPGPLEGGFDSYFGTPRTHSEPPLVFVRDRAIVGYDKDDPISVDDSPGTGAHGKQIGGKKAMEARPVDRIDPILAGEAEEFLARQKPGWPFFLYIAWSAPHNPIAPNADFRGSSNAGAYGDFVQQLDDSVGRVLAALDKHGHAANTLVVFTSDNGGRYENASFRAGHRVNGPLLGQKTDAWEGGHRVPFLVRWPGRVPTGSERKQFFHHVDLMATFADAAGAALSPGASPDGASELPAFLDPAKAPARRTEAVLHGTNGFALRQGNWVYLPKPGSGGKTVPEPAKPWALPYGVLKLLNSDVDEQGQIRPGAPAEQLYDLAADPSQKQNLAATQPERLKTMRERLKELAPAGRPKPSGE